MQITETLSDGLKRSFSVVVPDADVQERCQKRIKELAKTASLPGFRKGKVPTALLQKRFGEGVRGEVLEALVGEVIQDILKEKDLRPAEQPKLDDLKFESGEDLMFSINMEILPEIEMSDFSQIDVEQIELKISDDELDEALKIVADNRKTPVALEKPRAAANGDVVKIDFAGEVEGVSSDGLSGEGFNLELGSGRFIPGFEEQLVGLNAGDEKLVEVVFPADYGSTELAGKDAKFKVRVNEVMEQSTPELDDAFAETMGLENFAALQDAMRKDMVMQSEDARRGLMKRKLLDDLNDMHTFELPECMVTQEFDGIWRQVEAEKERGELDEADAAKSDDELKAEYKEIAERRVKLGLLLSEVGNKNEIEVTSDDLSKALMKETQKYPGQEKQLIEFYQKNQEAQMSLRAPILEEKVIDFIVAMAKTTKKEVTTEELRGLVDAMDESDKA